jgi:AraC-like DNA-binding protein
LYSAGANCCPRTCQFFGADGVFDAVSHPGFNVYTISIAEDHLLGLAELLGLPKAVEHLGCHEIVLVGENGAVRRLRQFIRQLMIEALKSRDLHLEQWFGRTLEQEVPTLVLAALASPLGSPSVWPDRLRDRALRRAEAYIEAHGQEPLTIQDLCQASGASERTLRYAFLERFGVSPNAYLKAHRLNAVRRDLREADPATSSVSDLGARWGFWHMSQFATDYRRFFWGTTLKDFGHCVVLTSIDHRTILRRWCLESNHFAGESEVLRKLGRL